MDLRLIFAADDEKLEQNPIPLIWFHNWKPTDRKPASAEWARSSGMIWIDPSADSENSGCLLRIAAVSNFYKGRRDC